jgi:predicted small secreted protein
MRIVTLIIILALGTLALSTSTGCETVKGFGKDVHDASSTVQSAFAVD